MFKEIRNNFGDIYKQMRYMFNDAHSLPYEFAGENALLIQRQLYRFTAAPDVEDR